MFSIYQFISQTPYKTVFIHTTDVKQLIMDCKNGLLTIFPELIEILKLTYSYQLVFINVEEHRIYALINSVKNNPIKLIKQIIETKHRIDYTTRKRIGYDNEQLLKPVIETVFGLPLIKTLNQYSFFDFYNLDGNGVIVELKSLTISNMVFIGLNKIVCKNLLFIFYCNLKKTLYYLQYSKSLFDTIPIREPNLKQKSTTTLSYCISIAHLTRFYITDKINIIFETDDTEKIKSLLSLPDETTHII